MPKAQMTLTPPLSFPREVKKKLCPWLPVHTVLAILKSKTESSPFSLYSLYFSLYTEIWIGTAKTLNVSLVSKEYEKYFTFIEYLALNKPWGKCLHFLRYYLIHTINL